MAQNITLLGASYSAVPAVLLPKTGGGTARFDDTTDATAAAAVYKKVNGSWVLQTNLANVFDANTNYVKGE